MSRCEDCEWSMFGQCDAHRWRDAEEPSPFFETGRPRKAAPPPVQSGPIGRCGMEMGDAFVLSTDIRSRIGTPYIYLKTHPDRDSRGNIVRHTALLPDGEVVEILDAVIVRVLSRVKDAED